MRIALILAGIFMLLASSADARNSDQSSDIDIVGSDTEFLEIASSCKDLNLDIIGSLAENINIVSPNLSPKDVEIVGSRTKSITITPTKSPMPQVPCPPPSPTVVNNYITTCEDKSKIYCQPASCASSYCCPTAYYCPPANYCPPKTKYPDTGGVHLGVDAWHGQYWYASKPNLPKWPQVP